MPRQKKIVQNIGLFGAMSPNQPPKTLTSKKKTARIKKEFPKEKVRTESSVFSVGDYLSHLGQLIGAEEVTVQGEISGFKTHPAGAFFSLKDQEGDGLLRCYMPPRRLRELGFDLQDGLLVNAAGVATIYRPRGELSFTVSQISLVGDGSLRQAYEALKQKLEIEGVFARKRPIPQCIERVLVLTSKTGEVIHDFRTNLRRLGFQISVCDIRVQGIQAAPDIVQAFRLLKRDHDYDLVVVMRGGGSLEDLQAFNDERVARAIFASSIPVLAAIGHDRDIPIASLAADLYVSTPSIAAVTVNQSWQEFESAFEVVKNNIFAAFENIITERKFVIESLTRRLLTGMGRLLTVPRDFRKRLERELSLLESKRREAKTAAIRATERLTRGFESQLAATRDRLRATVSYLDGVSPERNLRLGYSILKSASGRVVKSVDDVRLGEQVETVLASGTLSSTVKKINKEHHG